MMIDISVEGSLALGLLNMAASCGDVCIASMYFCLISFEGRSYRTVSSQ